MTFQEFLNHFEGVTGTGRKRKALCPGHDDTDPSLSITHSEDGKFLIHCFAGCSYKSIMTAAGLDLREFSMEENWKYVCEYIYSSTLKKVRFLKPDKTKTFVWKHKTSPQDTKWQNGAGGQSIPLYNASMLTLATNGETVFVVEGEKDADFLWHRGKIAVNSPHGATKGSPKGKWLPEYTAMFKGLNVVILQDNDYTGKVYSYMVGTALHGVALSVKVVDLALKWNELGIGGDISDVYELLCRKWGKLTADSIIIESLDSYIAEVPKFVPEDIPLTFDATTENKLDTISAQNLYVAELPEVKFLVEDFLPEGTMGLIVAPSKLGKSWLVMDLGMNVSEGTPFMKWQTNQAGVLYLALEDTNRRLQDRMKKVLNGTPPPKLFHFATKAPTLDNGLLAVLKNHVQQHPETKLIIIDTLQMIRGQSQNEGTYQQDYRQMCEVKDFVDEHGISILFVHHTRKLKDTDDVFNMISGTTGLMGAADTIFVITRASRYDKNATLHTTGRDIEASEYVITFNSETFKWEFVGNVKQVEDEQTRVDYLNSPVVKTVKSLLEKSAGKMWNGTAKDLLDAGERLLSVPIAPTAQSVGYELRKLKGLLYEHDKIVYATRPNGNAGLRHYFHYEREPVAFIENVPEPVVEVEFKHFLDGLEPVEF